MCAIPIFFGHLLFVIIQFVVFVFTLVATPLPMLKPSLNTTMQAMADEIAELYDIKLDLCVTLWGMTKKCNGADYYLKGNKAFGRAPIGCAHRRDVMAAAAAFAVISIVFTLVLLLLALALLARVRLPLVAPLLVNLLAVLTLVISWACVAAFRLQKMCGLAYAVSEMYAYGAGFGLMVTAWCLELLNFALLFLIACC